MLKKYYLNKLYHDFLLYKIFHLKVLTWRLGVLKRYLVPLSNLM